MRAIVRKEEFLKNVSFFLFALVLLKLFALDFVTLSQGGRSGVFIVLGLFLIGFALVYPRLARGKEKEEKGKIVKSEVNQQSESHPSQISRKSFFPSPYFKEKVPEGRMRLERGRG